MPRKATGEFDQMKYQEEWKKQNMRSISVKYKTDFVEQFREACEKLGTKQSDVFRKAMQETIDQAQNNAE